MAVERKLLDQRVDEAASALFDIARKIHQNPELRFEEHQAARWLSEAASLPGVAVEQGIAGLPTAFRARLDRGPGPKVAILAEYDALPAIGHACGHNLIAAGALGAFVALCSERDSLRGTVELVGTPAEEGGGGKIVMLRAGVFRDCTAAMMFHPFDRDLVAHVTLASRRLEFTFEGTPSHAAIAPWEGASALTACMDTFRLIDGQRVHMRDGVRVHGYIVEGGQAVNIVPERARAEFSVRAADDVELTRVIAIVRRCAEGAAVASGVRVAIRDLGGYRNLKSNMVLARRFADNLRALGRSPEEHDAKVGAGSTDMGDVSHEVPAIHPWLQICDTGKTTCHQHDFAACAASERGLHTMLVAAKAMARTAVDILEDQGLALRARAEFEATR